MSASQHLFSTSWSRTDACRGAKRINARNVWDRKKLDAAFEALPDDENKDNAWNDVIN
jgi:hypothetical protein